MYIGILLVYSGILLTESRLDSFVSLIDGQLAGVGLRIQEPHNLCLLCKEHNEPWLILHPEKC